MGEGQLEGQGAKNGRARGGRARGGGQGGSRSLGKGQAREGQEGTWQEKPHILNRKPVPMRCAEGQVSGAKPASGLPVVNSGDCRVDMDRSRQHLSAPGSKAPCESRSRIRSLARLRRPQRQLPTHPIWQLQMRPSATSDPPPRPSHHFRLLVLDLLALRRPPRPQRPLLRNGHGWMGGVAECRASFREA